MKEKKSINFKRIFLIIGIGALVCCLFLLIRNNSTFLAILISFIWPQSGIPVWRYLLDFSIFWSILIPVLIGTFKLCIWFVVISTVIDRFGKEDSEKFRGYKSEKKKIIRRFIIRKYDFHKLKDNDLIKRLAPLGYIGILLCGLFSGWFLLGIAIIKIFRYKYGFWVLLFGNIVKMVVCGLAILGVVGCLVRFLNF